MIEPSGRPSSSRCAGPLPRPACGGRAGGEGQCTTRGRRCQSAAAWVLRSPGLAIILAERFRKERIMPMPAQTRESGFKTNPDYKILFEPSPRRVRVKFNGEVIADSTNAHLLFETRHLPVYYFPRSDIRMDRMTLTDHHTFCSYNEYLNRRGKPARTKYQVN